VAANFAASFWTGFMGIVFVPQYIRFMGIESYGLVGFFASFQALVGLLDFGLGATINRETARLSALGGHAEHLIGLASTVEIIYWSVSGLIGGAVILLAGPIAEYWLNPDTLPRSLVKEAIVIMGFVVALRWPVSFYVGGLMGLQRQVGLAVVSASYATIRGLGALMVLWLIEPSVRAFFMFQIVAGGMETLTLALYWWRSVPRAGRRPLFDVNSLTGIWRFSLGMTGISVVALLLSQTDKIILSKVLSLEDFGYYSVAWAAAAVLYKIVGPIGAAFFPRLSQSVALQEDRELSQLYHKGSQAMAVFLIPVTSVLVVFSEEILFLWSGDTALSRNVAPVLSLLAIGTCLNGLMHMPYYAQLAHGWTSLTLAKG